MSSVPPKDKLIFAPGVSSSTNPSDPNITQPQPQSQSHSPSQPPKSESTIDPSSTTSNTETASSSSQPAAARAAQFQIGTLHRRDLHPHPLHQFAQWFSALPVDSVPETCVLSTAHLPSGRVSSRYVYLKEVDAPSSPSSTAGGSSSDADEGEGGFVVYSHFGPQATSLKARDFATNRWVSLAFWWKDVERQVRVEGKGELLSADESERYWRTRERGSRVGAWGSRQSQVLDPQDERDDDGRGLLESRVKEAEERFKDVEEVPLPPFWGGLRVRPVMVEFWQGRVGRLHDRFRYERVGGEGGEEGEGKEQKQGEGKKEGEGKGWRIERLSP